VAFHRRYETPIEFDETAAQDSDIGIYVQDGWKPNGRLTINGGVRVDFVRRFDDIYGVERMSSVNIGPRFGWPWSSPRTTAMSCGLGRTRPRTGQ
jgi:outer membrane receptor protein involved in Fe transport